MMNTFNADFELHQLKMNTLYTEEFRSVVLLYTFRFFLWFTSKIFSS